MCPWLTSWSGCHHPTYCVRVLWWQASKCKCACLPSYWLLFRQWWRKPPMCSRTIQTEKKNRGERNAIDRRLCIVCSVWKWIIVGITLWCGSFYEVFRQAWEIHGIQGVTSDLLTPNWWNYSASCLWRQKEWALLQTLLVGLWKALCQDMAFLDTETWNRTVDDRYVWSLPQWSTIQCKRHCIIGDKHWETLCAPYLSADDDHPHIPFLPVSRLPPSSLCPNHQQWSVNYCPGAHSLYSPHQEWKGNVITPEEELFALFGEHTWGVLWEGSSALGFCACQWGWAWWRDDEVSGLSDLLREEHLFLWLDVFDDGEEEACGLKCVTSFCDDVTSYTWQLNGEHAFKPSCEWACKAALL